MVIRLSNNRQRADETKKNGEIAFSLLEVMIALAIFFTATFVILALVSSGLKTARMLRNDRPNCGFLASQLVLSNQLEEGTEFGDFENLYPDYRWEITKYEANTGGLWQVDFAITKRADRSPVSSMSIQLFSPNSKPKRLGFQQ